MKQRVESWRAGALEIPHFTTPRLLEKNPKSRRRAVELALSHQHFKAPFPPDADEMTVHLRRLRHIAQGEEVKAADGAVGGDRRGRLILRHSSSFKAGPRALQQSLPQRSGGTEPAGLGAEFHALLGACLSN